MHAFLGGARHYCTCRLIVMQLALNYVSWYLLDRCDLLESSRAVSVDQDWNIAFKQNG